MRFDNQKKFNQRILSSLDRQGRDWTLINGDNINMTQYLLIDTSMIIFQMINRDQADNPVLDFDDVKSLLGDLSFEGVYESTAGSVKQPNLTEVAREYIYAYIDAMTTIGTYRANSKPVIKVSFPDSRVAVYMGVDISNVVGKASGNIDLTKRVRILNMYIIPDDFDMLVDFDDKGSNSKSVSMLRSKLVTNNKNRIHFLEGITNVLFESERYAAFARLIALYISIQYHTKGLIDAKINDGVNLHSF